MEESVVAFRFALVRFSFLGVAVFTFACLIGQIAPAQQQAAPEVLEYKGMLAPARQAEVAPRLDGLLLKINFTAGQLVKQGDLLFEFDSRDKELSVALAQAHLKQAEAQLRLAAVKLQNAQTYSPAMLLRRCNYWKRKPNGTSRPPSPTKPAPMWDSLSSLLSR